MNKIGERNENTKLTKRLEDIGINREGILKLLKLRKRDCIVIYSSCMENLGTDASDFDIYVIREDVSECRTELIDLDPHYYGLDNVAYLYLDVQYWSQNELKRVIEKINKHKNIGFEELKTLHRLLVGEVLYGKSFLHENMLDITELQEVVKEKYSVISDGLLHDCIGLYQNEELLGAIMCAREALKYAVCGYNASKGKINLKAEKWSAKIFMQLDASEREKTEYIKFMFGEVEYTIEYIEKLIIFVQDILNKNLNFLGKKHWLYKENYLMLDESKDILYTI